MSKGTNRRLRGVKGHIPKGNVSPYTFEKGKMKIKEEDQQLLGAFYDEPKQDIPEPPKKKIVGKWVAPAHTAPQYNPAPLPPPKYVPANQYVPPKQNEGVYMQGAIGNVGNVGAIGQAGVPGLQPMQWPAAPEVDQELAERKQQYALFMDALLHCKLKELTIKEFLFLQETPEHWYSKTPPKYYASMEARYDGFYSESRLQQITAIAERVLKDLVAEFDGVQ
jgi:hypothetical protein